MKIDAKHPALARADSTVPMKHKHLCSFSQKLEQKWIYNHNIKTRALQQGDYEEKQEDLKQSSAKKSPWSWSK